MAVTSDPLGPSGGGVAPFAASPDNQLVQRVANLRRWYRHPAMAAWLHPGGGGCNRLYNLRKYTPEAAGAMLDGIWAAVAKAPGVAAMAEGLA